MNQRTDYTVEVYKADRRTTKGERRVLVRDHSDADLDSLRHLYSTTWLARDGYRCEFHETWVMRKNMITDSWFRERYDTPLCCSPSSETYWSM